MTSAAPRRRAYLRAYPAHERLLNVVQSNPGGGARLAAGIG